MNVSPHESFFAETHGLQDVAAGRVVWKVRRSHAVQAHPRKGVVNAQGARGRGDAAPLIRAVHPVADPALVDGSALNTAEGQLAGKVAVDLYHHRYDGAICSHFFEHRPLPRPSALGVSSFPCGMDRWFYRLQPLLVEQAGTAPFPAILQAQGPQRDGFSTRKSDERGAFGPTRCGSVQPSFNPSQQAQRLSPLLEEFDVHHVAWADLRGGLRQANHGVGFREACEEVGGFATGTAEAFD